MATPRRSKRPAYNRLMLLQMSDRDYRKNRAALRAYLDRSTALRSFEASGLPAPVKAKRGSK